jgi:hypothetical protein
MQEAHNLSRKPQEGYAFIVLLHDGDDANGLAHLLEDVRLPESSTPTVFVAPEVRGVNFFEARSTGQLDEWWASNVPSAALPVYLLLYEEELDKYFNGFSGIFYIGVPNQDLVQEYEKSAQVIAFLASGPLDFATVIMRDFSGKTGFGGDIFDEGEAIRMAALSSDFPLDLDDKGFQFDPPTVPLWPSPFGWTQLHPLRTSFRKVRVRVRVTEQEIP